MRKIIGEECMVEIEDGKRKKNKKRIIVTLTIAVGVGCALWFLGIRFHMPLRTLLFQKWSFVTVYNGPRDGTQLNAVQAEELYEFMKDIEVTTVGMGTDRNGGLYITTDVGDFTLFSDFIMWGIFRYEVPKSERDYVEKIRSMVNGFESK